MNGSASTDLICFDTSLFIYFFEQNPKFYKQAEVYFRKLEQGSIKAVTTILTLTEILSYKNSSVPEAKIIVEFFDVPNLSVAEVTRSVAIEAARIRREDKFRLADSIQLATAVCAKAQAFITNDQKLRGFKKVKIILIS